MVCCCWATISQENPFPAQIDKYNSVSPTDSCFCRDIGPVKLRSVVCFDPTDGMIVTGSVSCFKSTLMLSHRFRPTTAVPRSICAVSDRPSPSISFSSCGMNYLGSSTLQTRRHIYRNFPVASLVFLLLCIDSGLACLDTSYSAISKCLDADLARANTSVFQTMRPVD